jgi:hypothetical protein
MKNDDSGQSAVAVNGDQIDAALAIGRGTNISELSAEV